MRLADIPRVLQRLRADPQAWGEVACAVVGSGKTWRDVHGQARHAALVALQYDRQREDRALIVHLLEQELLAQTQSPFGGMGDSLRLAAFLAATLNDLQLAWVMLAVKRANCDTGCGFEVEALFSGGVEQTWAMVLASERPDREAFIAIAANEDGQPLCSQADVDHWSRQQHQYFPPSWEQESIAAKLSLCDARRL